MSEIINCSACNSANRIKEPAGGGPKVPVCGKCGYPLGKEGEVWHLSDDNFDKLVANARKPVLIDFWAEWCGPCKMFAPHFEKFARLHPELVLAKVDVDRAPRSAELFMIQTIPSIVFFREGKEIRRGIGALSVGQLEELVRS